MESRSKSLSTPLSAPPLSPRCPPPPPISLLLLSALAALPLLPSLCSSSQPSLPSPSSHLCSSSSLDLDFNEWRPPLTLTLTLHYRASSTLTTGRCWCRPQAPSQGEPSGYLLVLRPQFRPKVDLGGSCIVSPPPC